LTSLRRRGTLRSDPRRGPPLPSEQDIKDVVLTLPDAFHLSAQDLALLWTCPLIAGVASLVRAWTSELNLSRPPEFEFIGRKEREESPRQTIRNKLARAYWVGGMCAAGTAIGFGLALLFLGAIQPTSSAVGRIWFLCLALGYATPVVLRHIDKRVEDSIGK